MVKKHEKSLEKVNCYWSYSIWVDCAENECIIKKRKIDRRKGDWKFNMNRRIKDLGADISKISQMNDLRPTPKMTRNTNLMKTKCRIDDEQTRSTSLEILKQHLYALNNRLSWYQRRQKDVDVEKFWKLLYENKKGYSWHGCRNTKSLSITSRKQHTVK